MALVEIAKLELPPTPLVREGSWGSRDIGSYSSTMTFYLWDGAYQIEWDIPDLDECEHIGLTFDGDNRLVDYDGIMGGLPAEAVKLIRSAGFVVPSEFTERCDEEDR